MVSHSTPHHIPSIPAALKPCAAIAIPELIIPNAKNNGLRLFFLFISIYFLLLAAANGIYIVEESGVSAVSIDKMTNVVSLSYKILNILIYFAGAFFLFMYFYKIANWMASHAKK